ncbi:MAG: hypothetical protein QM765_08440 [Myxococcales bacterium]
MTTLTDLRGRADLWRDFLRGIDRPARQAHELGRRSVAFTAAPALVGTFLVAVSTIAAGLVDPTRTGLPRADALKAWIEALALSVPAMVVFGTYLRLRLTPGALLAAAALGLLAAGIVSLALVPLVAFFALVSQGVPLVLRAQALLVTGVALATVASVVHRVIVASDPTHRAAALARFFGLGLFALFAVRLAPSVLQLIASR